MGSVGRPPVRCFDRYKVNEIVDAISQDSCCFITNFTNQLMAVQFLEGGRLISWVILSVNRGIERE